MLILVRFSYILVIAFTINFSVFSNKSKAFSKLPTFYFGSANAPVTIYEFISLSCTYCVDNINFFIPPNNQENAISKLIKNGKVKLIVMDFPIHGKVDFLAHSILYYSSTNEQYFSLLKLFLNNQDKWFNAKNPTDVIINYGKLSGLTNEAINNFKKDTSITNLITINANAYIKKYNIRATPTTIIEKSNKPINANSFTEVGLTNLSKLEEVINSLLKNE